ncbi:MAG: hypothetical protein M5U26_04775 [Planctomycetota bacterium]|nr:hypothetical protein [Planctomycetota bacterium]
MIGFRRRSSLPPAFLAACLCACLPGAASAAETPTSTGPVAQVDEPVLRIPMLAKPPSIDGVMEPKEWEDASALSGFWYDYGQADFRYLAPDETQVEIYAGFDKENLYLCGVSPIYPEKSWMKTRARFTDVLHHPLYGILWDDHYEIELRPYPDNVKGFRLGLFKWVVNPTNTFSDQCWTQQHGDGFKYKSNVKVRSSADGQRWILELAIPLQSFLHLNYAEKEEHGAPLVPIPPPTARPTAAGSRAASAATASSSMPSTTTPGTPPRPS